MEKLSYFTLLARYKVSAGQARKTKKERLFYRPLDYFIYTFLKSVLVFVLRMFFESPGKNRLAGFRIA